jgi:coenzyme F420-reducing hydrogenase delta subunit
VEGVSVVKLPCSGMIQPQMIEEALKAGASGVIVTGCQIGDCYFREGNKMIRDRLLGLRPPGLKKAVDRRRVLALWLARPQTERFISEAKEFVSYLAKLPEAETAAKPSSSPSSSPAAAPKPAVSEVKAEAPKAEPETKTEEAKADEAPKEQA